MIRSSRGARLAWLSALVASCLIFASCAPAKMPIDPASGTASVASGHSLKVLNIGATAEPKSLDPSTDPGAGTLFVLLYNVYETLVKLDANNKIQPLLAKSWQVSPDRMTYTFTLNDATFASGKPVDAKAVVTSINRIKDGQSFHALKNEMSVVESAKVKDAHTVVVKLKQPSNMWIYNMTSTAGIIYDPDSLKDLKIQPAGSGPFVFKEWRKGESITLARNDSYWGKKASVRGAVFRYYSDPNAMNAAMLSGQLDIISNLTVPDAIGQFSDASRYQIIKGITSGEVVLGYNHSVPALKDVRIRQAINYAIDRVALVKSVTNSQGKLIGSMVSPADPWYEDLSKAYPFNPEKARQLLKEAGHESGLTLRLRFPNLPYSSRASQFIASQLKDVGISVKLDELEFPTRWLDQVYKKGDYDMTIIAHVELRDLDRWADPNYYWHYNNTQFQQLIRDADKASNMQEQIVMLKKAAKILSDDAAADFLWLLPNVIITTPDIVGVVKDGTSLSFDITNVSVK